MRQETTFNSLLASLSPYLHPRVLAVFFLGFSSGLPLALSGSTLKVWLAEVDGNIKTIGLFTAASLPYTIKFLWSPLIDQLQLPFFTATVGRRRGWMLFSQLVLIALIVMLGLNDPSEFPRRAFILAIMIAVASATQDIVIDAYRVELLSPAQQPAGASMSVFGYYIGMLVSGAGALYMAEDHSWQVVYQIMAACLIVGVVTVLLTGEPEGNTSGTSFLEQANFKRQQKMQLHLWFKNAVINPFMDFIGRQNWQLILAFVMFYKLADLLVSNMTNPFLIAVGFSKSEIATIVKLYGFVALMAGSLAGGALLNRCGLMRSLWICGIMQMLSNLMFAYLAHRGYDTRVLAATIVMEKFAAGMGTAAFVCYLSGLCNISYTATQYALFSSLSTVLGTWLSVGSGFVVAKAGWFNFFILGSATAIPGLIVLQFLYHYTTRPRNVAAYGD